MKKLPLADTPTEALRKQDKQLKVISLLLLIWMVCMVGMLVFSLRQGKFLFTLLPITGVMPVFIAIMQKQRRNIAEELQKRT